MPADTAPDPETTDPVTTHPGTDGDLAHDPDGDPEMLRSGESTRQPDQAEGDDDPREDGS